MADGTPPLGTTTVDRRAFLELGALPVAAALAGGASLQAAQGARATPAAPGPRLPIRVGIIGAGENVRDVMIPAFRRIPECQLVAVANTSLASSRRVATEFDIPRPYANWRALLDDAEVEMEFINAIRGLQPVALNTFEIGAHYMAWTEAVHRSAKAGRVVHLPL